ncbi:MAG TPA: FtsX-like permease family protein, partial [Rhodothermales bacterium]|nr:FtsX-like permease family protein [Rhodothermales bacterium]
VDYEEPPHNPLYSYILSGIALLVLLIACINFMILSIGRSTTRAKEVGMRKALGARRGQIMKQFWGEAILMGLVALLLGVLLAILVLPLFNQLTGRELSLGASLNANGVLILLGLIAIVGLVAGGYPAAVLSGFNPVAVLKGDVKSRGNSFFTRSLIVVQYTLSIVLIVSTIVMARQLHYMLNRDLGFEGEQVVVLHTYNVTDKEAPAVIERFRHDLLPDPRIVKIARAGYSFTHGGDWNGWLDAEGNQRRAANFGIDYDYLDVMGMQLVAGRNFSREHPSDPTGGVLVNEALVRQFGIKDPIGYKLTGWNSWYVKEPPTIIGVVKDFNFRSLHEEVAPAVLNMQPDYYIGMGAMLIKISGNDVPGTISLLEKTWNTVLPGRPFSYSFLDDDMAAQYQTEQRWGKILTYSSLLAILIACMGLFGLATLSTVRRTKEIGIRKVLGASVSGIVALVSREFVVLVLISGLAAAPLAYYAMHRWLDTFAYRIPLGPGAFILAGLAALLIALLTVSYQSVKAALANPASSLRYE